MEKKIESLFPEATMVKIDGDRCTIETYSGHVSYQDLALLSGLLLTYKIEIRVCGMEGDTIEITCEDCRADLE